MFKNKKLKNRDNMTPEEFDMGDIYDPDTWDEEEDR